MVKLSQVLDELVEEKGLNRALLSSIITEGMLAAYKKRYPDLPLTASYNKRTDDIEVKIAKSVVQTVEDDDTQISLRKAKTFEPNIEIGQDIEVPFQEPIGRIEILKAKQVIAQKIRGIEASIVYNEFKPKEGTIIHGVIHKCERNGMTLKIQETLAFLPKSLSMPTDKCVVGYTIRALLKEVLPEPKHENQLILDRSSPEFLKKLFELEVPEVFEKLVEVKKVARVAGYKAKVLVMSNDENIDPVGTCVGVAGARIKPILRELSGEKIDIIAWTTSPEELVKNSLKPAQVNKVEIQADNRALVWVDEDQRSIAIGKMGQNIALASQLTNYNIQLVKLESSENIEAVFEEMTEDTSGNDSENLNKD